MPKIFIRMFETGIQSHLEQVGGSISIQEGEKDDPETGLSQSQVDKLLSISLDGRIVTVFIIMGVCLATGILCILVEVGVAWKNRVFDYMRLSRKGLN